MSLDPRYLIAPALEQFYINKITGLPLANGEITFYKDNERTALKSIYTLSGAPPNYSYVELPNPITLSAVGTIQDANGNNVLPFYFPYDDQGNLALYYVTVYSSDSVLQFTREGWPNTSLDNNKQNDNVINLIPNGQFLIHNNIPAQKNKVAGEITQAVTTLAPGGWTFDRPEQSTAKDLVVFERFGSSVSNPSGYPRYAIRIENQLPSPGDLVKDLRISFHNVNRFASKDDYYTFAFAAQTNTGNALSVTALVIKNFGQGGSPVEEKIINTVTLTSTYTLINIPFIFGENQNKTLGLNDGDNVAIALRFPTNSVFDISLTDFILAHGNTQIESYPQTTDSTVISQSLTGSLPTVNADGFDLYLHRIRTLEGERYDTSVIGRCFFHVREDPMPGELRCDGSQYLYTGYSSDGVPYKRLGDVLLLKRTYPRYGTGVNFVSTKLITDDLLVLTTNAPGSATAASAGTSGFTVTTRVKGNNYQLTGFHLGSDTVYIKQTIKGAVTPPAANTASPYLTVTDLRNYQFQSTGIGTFNTFAIFSVQVTSADNAIAGTYLTFSNTTTHYYVYFTVAGQGTDPAPAGLTGIQIDFDPGMSINDRASFIAETLGGHQVTTLVTTPASAITAGSYFNFSVNSMLINQNYYVWAKIKGAGSDPSLNGIGIPYELTGSETAKEVANSIMLAIHKFYVTVPDFRGQSIRIWDNGAGNDPDVSLRAFPYGQGQIAGDVIGSFQLDEIYSHNHQNNTVDSRYYPQITGVSSFDGKILLRPDTTYATYATGGSESRPSNHYLNMFINY